MQTELAASAMSAEALAAANAPPAHRLEMRVDHSVVRDEPGLQQRALGDAVAVFAQLRSCSHHFPMSARHGPYPSQASLLRLPARPPGGGVRAALPTAIWPAAAG